MNNKRHGVKGLILYYLIYHKGRTVLSVVGCPSSVVEITVAQVATAILNAKILEPVPAIRTSPAIIVRYPSNGQRTPDNTRISLDHLESLVIVTRTGRCQGRFHYRDPGPQCQWARNSSQ